MAVKKVVEIDVDIVRANGGLEKFKENFEKVEQSTKSLKSQLREAQEEVVKLSEKFGATSKEAVEASKRAGELKDKIGDAKSLTEAFNPDAKFKSLTASLSGAAGGLSAVTGAMGLLGGESKNTEAMILKVQSAMAISTGIQALGEARDSFKQFGTVAVNALKGIKNAIGATGIGLLLVAAGALYAYWDDIKEAVSGVSEEQKRLTAQSQKNVDQENEKLKLIGSQDNILKLQGKSEKEILAIKIKQTDEAISANKINIENQKTTNKLAEIGAKRNYEMLKSYIDFVSAPVRFLYENAAVAINKVINLINKIPGVNIKGNLDEKFGDKASEFITKLAFDPDKTKKEGEQTVKNSQDSLNKLLNDRAGYKLASNDIDKKSLDDKKKNIKEEEDLEKQRLKSLTDLQDNYLKQSQDANAKTDQEKLDLQKQRDLAEINQLAKTENEKANLKALFNEKYFTLQTELDAKLKKESEEKQLKDSEAKSEFEDAQWLRLQELTMSQSEFQKLQLQQKLDNELILAEGNEQLKQELKDKFIADSQAIDQKDLDNKKILKEQEISMAIQTFGILSDLLGKQSKVGKAFAVANALMNTYQGITAGVKLGYPAAIPAVISASVTGFKAVKDILATNPNTSSASAPSTGGGSGGGQTPAPPQFNLVSQSSTNQLTSTIANQQNQPIQTYVVGNQVTSQQALDRNAQQTATFG